MSSDTSALEPTLHPLRPGVLRLPDYLVGAAVFAISFVVYYRTLAPTVYGEDSGELIAAAYTLGIPHPTGYPLWCLIAKLFISLIAAGDVAWRANLMSAVFGSATVMIAALSIGALVQHRVAAMAAALGLAFSLEFWEQSVIAEVYSLNAFVTALCMLLLIVWGQTKRNYLLYLAGLLFGLGLANHQVLLLAAPAFAIYVVSIAGLHWRNWTMHLLTILLALLGLSAYLYLPIRSALNPAMDWGNPETWPAFVDVVTRAQYRFIITDGPRSWGLFGEQLLTFLKIYLEQFTLGPGLLAPFGIVVLWSRGKRAVCVMLCVLWLCTAIGSIVIPNYGSDRMSIWLNTTYWIPVYYVTAILIGAAIAGVCAATPRTVVRVIVLIGLSATAVFAPLIAHYPHNDKSDYFLASDYARNVLASLAPGAIYFGDTDLALFPAMYYQIVEGIRSDVQIANPYGYPVPAVYGTMPPEVTSTFARIPTEQDEQLVFEWLVKHSDRPVYSTTIRRGDGIVAYNVGLVYRYAIAGETVPLDDPWDRYVWHSVDESDFDDDWSAEVVLYEYHLARGRYYMDGGQLAYARNAFERAAEIGRENKEGLNNLGCVVAGYGEYADAVHQFESALALDPGFGLARMNLGRAFMKLGDFARAKAEFELVLARDGTVAGATELIAYCERRVGE